MELASRGSLYKILQDKSIPDLEWSLRLSIALNIAMGLHCLHTNQPIILHRDLKSLNVLLRSDWSAFISDFGFARYTSLAEMTTSVLGTPSWMAPEMFQSDVNATSAVDIYSFGMILYELLTRKIPFQIEKEKRIKFDVKLGNRPVIPNVDECKSVMGCTEDYLRLMKDCWNQDPVKRPNAKSIIERLTSQIKALSTPLTDVASTDHEDLGDNW